MGKPKSPVAAVRPVAVSNLLACFAFLALLAPTQARSECPEICKDPAEAASLDVCISCTRKADPINEIDKGDPRFSKIVGALKIPTNEVYFGVEVSSGEFSETVLIQTPFPRNTLCTGVLISDRVVLTARHCPASHFVGLEKSAIHFGPFKGEDNKPAYKKIEVQKCWFPRTKYPDIALLLLSQPAPKEAARAVFATQKDLSNYGRVIGFGYDQQLTAGVKRRADIAIVSKSCSGRFDHGTPRRKLSDQEGYGCNPGLELVAGNIRERPVDLSADTCDGDSGGPLFVAPAESAGTYELIEGAFSGGGYRLAALTSRPIKSDYFPAPFVKDENGEDVKCGNGGIYSLIGPSRKKIEAGTAALMSERLPGPNDGLCLVD